ncbi:hypothetical protein B484DRAFT_447617 [Ochromonadaceae sp. CCMP2298]|nr:hypothetical protein B484DRAFT_447617 [Ochromonadaceae sp. CCMP2298]
MQDSQPTGGYPCSLFLAPPQDDFKCCICMEVMRDPVQVCSEHHTYCRGCINRWKGGGRTTCPECRAPFSKDEPARVLKNIIEKLEVRCSHACDGGSCSSSGDAADGAEAGRQQKKRKQGQGAEPSVPASCEWRGQLRHYEAHMAACPFVEVSCPFSGAGCAFRAARRDMGAHSSDMSAHFLVLMTTVAAGKADCAAVKAENEAIKGEISSLRRYVSILHASGEEAAAGGEWVSSLHVPAVEEKDEDEYIYTGQQRRGELHGFGRALWVHGDSYDGQWRDDMRHGHGIYKSEGGIYTGQWRADNHHGLGEMRWEDGDSYNGQWRDNHQHGHGLFTWEDGESYDGQWKHGESHGAGVYRYPNGDSEQGQWVKDSKQGEFIYTRANGKCYERVYKDGDIMSETPIS